MSEYVVSEKDGNSVKINYIEPKEYLLVINNREGIIVSIEYDGTVMIHQHGKEKEAAEIFWNSMANVFKNKYQKIEKEVEVNLMHE